MRAGQTRGDAGALTALREVDSVAELLLQQGSQESQMCRVYHSDFGVFGGEVTDRTSVIAAAQQQLLVTGEEARLRSQNYFQSRSEFAESYAQAARDKSEHPRLQKVWHGEGHGLTEQIESIPRKLGAMRSKFRQRRGATRKRFRPSRRQPERDSSKQRTRQAATSHRPAPCS